VNGVPIFKLVIEQENIEGESKYYWKLKCKFKSHID